MRLLITTQAVDRDDPILGFFHGWLLEFAKHFEHIDVICLREGVHSLPKNVQVQSLGKEEGENRLKYLFRFYRLFFNSYVHHHVDFVFFHMGALYNVLALPFFLMRKIRKTKFIWWKTHGKIGKLLDHLALFAVDSVVTAGSKSFDIDTVKRRVVGHAIDTSLFQTSEEVSRIQSKLITVGRIVPIKRIEVAIETLVLLRGWEKSPYPYTLTIVGSADDVRYETSLRALCVEKALDTVDFIGSKTQTELTVLYRQSTILIHPAFEAGFDKVVLEAMSAGVIPLTSIQSFEHILSPFGLFVSPNNVEGYANAVLRITTMSIEERVRLQRSLREIVVKEHSISTLPARIFGV